MDIKTFEEARRLLAVSTHILTEDEINAIYGFRQGELKRVIGTSTSATIAENESDYYLTQVGPYVVLIKK